MYFKSFNFFKGLQIRSSNVNLENCSCWLKSSALDITKQEPVSDYF